MTWQIGLATGVLLAIVAVSYLLPKLIIGRSLAAGLLVGSLSYEVVGMPPAQAVFLLAVLWLPGAIAVSSMVFGPEVRMQLPTIQQSQLTPPPNRKFTVICYLAND